MKKHILLFLICITFATYNCFAQYPNNFKVIPQSQKPDFESLLQGSKSWEFGDFFYNGKDMEGADGGDFGYAYVVKEIIKFMNATIPDALHGKDYKEESTTNLQVDVTATATPKLGWDGHWRWDISCKLTFSPYSIGYYYPYTLPNIRVIGNDFSDHSLYNAMLRNITQYIYKHSNGKEIHLKKIITEWNEQKLKNAYNLGLNHPVEGIYEEVRTDIYSDKGFTGNKYKLGVKYIDGDLFCIYLDGAYLWDDWKEGELKAILETTGNPNIYKIKWFGNLKQSMEGYISFAQGTMKTVLNGEETTYLKLYPTNSNIGASPSDSWSGTGFALNNGYVVTNYHVIEEAKSITIKGIKGDFNTDLVADVVATDKYNDLALLKITDNRFNGFGTIPYKIKTNTSEVGENVFVLGYPLTSTMGDEIKLTTGVISSKTGFQGDVSLYQISAPVQPGNSGGPLFDNNGNLIGIINSKHKGTENVSYAIKASYLRNLIESYTSSTILPSNNTLSGLPLTEKVKKAKNFVFMINCSSKNNGNQINSGLGQSQQREEGSFSNSSATIIRTINNPSVSSTKTKSTIIKKVILSKDFTAIEIYFKPSLGQNTYYQYCNIEKNTFINANDKHYFITSTDNIKTAPDKTYFINELTFTLYFPPIPENTSSIDLIESSSSWKWYGIQLK